ncbi:ABC transporter permease [Sphingomonas sp. 2R-10]|uniref:ABC transporter permease n=1 Tax=Sphingomonas sp. 2R-10 TaxID=3045148 RepID=UPI000F7875AE|nr:ABC transporter permease [Sphingomonas sp. 2R-10]MDJ0275264.1 ABC transporter permease [Sphingomonas sp. 2R-10]
MNRFALTSLYRSLTRHKLYSALNIGGLAVGIAVFLVLSLYVRFETGYEKWLPDHDGIYRVRSEWNIPGSPFDGVTPQTAGGVLDMMKEDFPGLRGTRISTGGKVIRGGIGAEEKIARVDPDFLDVFRLDVVQGDARSALRQPSDMVLTQAAARRYFGSADPIGRTLTIQTGKEPAVYRAVAVVRDLPANTDLDVAILIPIRQPPPAGQALWRNLGAPSLETWLRFDTPDAARAFARKLPGFVDRHGADLGKAPSDTLRLPLTPIADMHLAPVGKGQDSRRLTVATLGIVGMLTLLIAIVNYVNLATARAGLRAREVAMRKVLGADRAALVRQFLGEAMLMVGVAALIGGILAELGLPLVNAAGGLSLSMPYGVVVPGLVALTIVVGLLAGFYPALLLSRFPAASVLASSRTPGGGRAGTRTREALVVFQFALAIAFMIGTAVLFAQMHHVRQTDLGFDREGLIVVPAMTDSGLTPADRASLMAAFREMPNVTKVTAATIAAGGSFSHAAVNMPVPGRPGDGPTLRMIEVGPDFFDTYGMRLLAGRVFDPRYGGDDSTDKNDGGSYNIIISRKAVSALGFASPQAAIGRTVGAGDRLRTIVGVVDDARFLSPRVAIDPTFYAYKARLPDWAIATLRVHGDPRAVMDRIRAKWRQLAPAVPFEAAYADRRVAQMYADDDRATRLFGIGAGLAVLIGCVGLWGLASFNTARRVKEIGIRKTLGASSADIVKLLVGQFLRPVLIANLVAWPLAFVAMRTWLTGFDDRIALSPLFFVGAGLLALVIAVVTVLGQALRASRAAPAWALRHD